MNRCLKARIIELFGSQWEFARSIKAHESDVSRVVRNRKTLGLDEQKRWAEALQCSREKLFESANPDWQSG
jgi:plasmid maintenance system antidote protein VapI